jgi:adenosylcobyric acid synthase
MNKGGEHHREGGQCLAVFGTGSDVGKSVVTTALCRHFRRKGYHIAPFKAQNMSNNSGVTPEGLEMGRAQIVQAEAAGIAPHVDMNPILLKPTSEIGSQVVLMGEVFVNTSAADYHTKKDQLQASARGAFDRLKASYGLVVMEGAGSCAEVNLMSHDIVNFRMAEYAGAPVILVADIHRGGVFAQIVGTLACLSAEQSRQIAGFIINRFRGDIRLFQDGVEWIERRTGKPVFGVLPWYRHFRIEQEDSVVIENPVRVSPDRIISPAIAVIRIPHISNFTDFEPLAALNGLYLHFLEIPQDLSQFSAVILPGSKSTRYDLQWLIRTGWKDRVHTYLGKGGSVLGVCGGYQMLGRKVHDPDGLEGEPGASEGLGLLPVETILKAPKTTTRTKFSWNGSEGVGYEIHMGQTDRREAIPLFTVLDRNGISASDHDGCIGEGGRVMGTYIHGLFDNPGITRRWLDLVGLSHVAVPPDSGYVAKEKDYNLLADHFAAHVDTETIEKLLCQWQKDK